MAQNSTLIRKWFEEVWNQGKESTIDQMCHPEAIGSGQAQHGAEIHGPEEFKQLCPGIRAAFSEIHVDIHDTIEQDDRVVARWTMAMLHTGAFLDIAPTNKRVSVNGISIQRFENGKIVAGWDCWDQLALLVQLGAVPNPGFCEEVMRVLKVASQAFSRSETVI
jgi:predicted ester cyclase